MHQLASEEILTDSINDYVGQQRVSQSSKQTRRMNSFTGKLQRAVFVRFAALITLSSGVANLYSALNPLPPARQSWLRKLLPLEFFHYPRSFTLLTGFALIIVAVNIYRRKYRAFQLAISLSVFSFVAHLLKGHDFEEALFSLLLAITLWWMRGNFTVRSSRLDWRAILLRIGVALSVAFGYGLAGFWLLDEREFGVNFNWQASIHQTLLYLTWFSGGRLVPHTHYASWFLDSLSALSVAVIAYAGVALFRPIIYRFHILPNEHGSAVAILKLHGRGSLDYFKLWPDKSYFFSSSGRSFIAYSVGANFAVALADPVGPPEEMAETICQFRQYCEDNGWGVAFHQTLPDFLPAYLQNGFKKLKLGDDAIVDLTQFTLDGKTYKRLRSRNNQLEKSGLKLCHYTAPVSDKLMAQLREVSDEWLQLPGRRERKFTVGAFDPAYLQSTPIVTVEDKDGKVLAFVNLIPSYHQGETTIDLMRHRTEAPNGTMDYLFCKLMEHQKAVGYTRFNLGMAPMSGFQDREEATAAEKAVHLFVQRMTFLFSFSGLKAWKAKFASHWEPRYIIYRSALDLPKIGIALGKVSEVTGWQSQHRTLHARQTTGGI